MENQFPFCRKLIGYLVLKFWHNLLQFIIMHSMTYSIIQIHNKLLYVS